MLNWTLMWESLPLLLSGAAVTAQLTAVSLVAGMALALPLALMRTAPHRALRLPAFGYIFFFRGTPLLVQIFLIYYGLGQFEWVRQSPLWPILREAWWCAIIALTLNTAAYTAEILRGGIEAVPKGEVEAARALGMSRALTLRKIILPRAFRLALPAYGNEIILLLKGSALASTVTLLDLTGVARVIVARTYAPYEVFLVAGLIYLGMTFLVTRAIAVAEFLFAPERRPARSGLP